VKEAGPHPTDRHVGLRLRERRTILGLSQQGLAGFLGMSFQQVQKYESGMNRISASRLFILAKFLHTEVGYFFEGLPSDASQGDPARTDAGSASEASVQGWHKRETLELVRAYCAIPDQRVREQLVLLISSCSQVSEQSDPTAAPGGRKQAMAGYQFE